MNHSEVRLDDHLPRLGQALIWPIDDGYFNRRCSDNGRFSDLTRLTQNRRGSLLEMFTCAHVQPWRRRLGGLMCREIGKHGADVAQ